MYFCLKSLFPSAYSAARPTQSGFGVLHERRDGSVSEAQEEEEGETSESRRFAGNVGGERRLCSTVGNYTLKSTATVYIMKGQEPELSNPK